MLNVSVSQNASVNELTSVARRLSESPAGIFILALDLTQLNIVIASLPGIENRLIFSYALDLSFAVMEVRQKLAFTLLQSLPRFAIPVDFDDHITS